VFYLNLSLRDYIFLMNNKHELTEAELYQLLAHNVCFDQSPRTSRANPPKTQELMNYDPVAEAFKIYDPNDTGFIDLDVFREILGNLGFGDITDQDIKTLIDTADVDGLECFLSHLPTLPWYL
jgi:Ca2+-binding EF-hand superfamily protein